HQAQQGGVTVRRTTGSSSFVSVRSINGVTERVEVQREIDPISNQVRTRMFINGIEVDPETKQPLAAPAAIPEPAPAAPAAPAPSPITPEDESSTPPAPTPTAPPAQKAEPMPQGTTF
ncbi:MAG: hypothetical protein R3Y56_03045, partial [Akkermansia sp.]